MKSFSKTRSRISSQMRSQPGHHQVVEHEMVVSLLGRYVTMLINEVGDWKTERFCFYQGKVIDEFIRLLRLVNTSSRIELFREMRQFHDLTTAAKNHFHNKIIPRIQFQRFVAANSRGTQCDDQPLTELKKSLEDLSKKHEKEVAELKEKIDSLTSIVEDQQTQLSTYKSKLEKFEHLFRCLKDYSGHENC